MHYQLERTNIESKNKKRVIFVTLVTIVDHKGEPCQCRLARNLN